MATQAMQVTGTEVGSPALRRTTVIIAIATALVVGAVIGRQTAGTSKTESIARPAASISLVGTNSADAARRAEVYEALAGIDGSITLVGTNSSDAAMRAEVYQALSRLGRPTSETASRLTDAERRALVMRLVAAQS